MHNDVVEHIFMYGEIVCGNDERDTHYFLFPRGGGCRGAVCIREQLKNQFIKIRGKKDRYKDSGFIVDSIP